MSTTHAEARTTSALRPRAVIGYGFGDAGCNIAFQMTGLFLLLYYTDVVGIRPSDAAGIFLLVKIWDGFADITAGRIVDRTMSRWGKFRPFLVWYSLPLLLSNLLCFISPFSDYGWKLVWAYATYALLGLLYSMVNIPYGSLAGAMSQNSVDRSRLSSSRMVGSGVTVLLLSFFVAPRVRGAEDLRGVFLLVTAIFTVVGMAFFLTTFFTSKEVVYREVKRVSLKDTLATVGRNGPLLRLCLSSVLYLTGQSVLSALGLYFANYVFAQYPGGGAWLAAVVTVMTTGAVLYVAPFGPTIMRAVGKKWGFVYGCGLATIGGLLLALGSSLALGLVGLFLSGAGTAVLGAMTWALESDTVEYGEFKTGIRTEGATYAAFSFTRKVGQAVGGAMGAYVLTLAAYQAGTGGQAMRQTQATLDGIQRWGGFLPAVCFLAAGLVMASYPLTEKRFQEIYAAIQDRRRQIGTARSLSSE